MILYVNLGLYSGQRILTIGLTTLSPWATKTNPQLGCLVATMCISMDLDMVN